jgi:thiol:disulfide interchange protein
MNHGNVHSIENEEEFDAILMTAEEKLVAVDFYADW